MSDCWLTFSIDLLLRNTGYREFYSDRREIYKDSQSLQWSSSIGWLLTDTRSNRATIIFAFLSPFSQLVLLFSDWNCLVWLRPILSHFLCVPAAIVIGHDVPLYR